MPGTFAVHFTDPSARFGVQPPEPWKLAGPGEIVVEADRLVLRGEQPRAFRSSAKTEIPIPLADIVNVLHEGKLVQCQVRMPGKAHVLQVWLADEQAAAALTRALPKERTENFEKQIAEHKSFYTALDALGTKPRVSLVLLFLNCAIFVATVLGGAGLMEVNGAVLIPWGTNYGPLTLNGESWRLFTSMFLHFGLLHIALNMWALWDLGQVTEKLYGSAYYLVLYLFAGLAGSLASLYWHPDVNSAGASGAIFGVLGGLFAFVLNPKTRIPAHIAAAHRNSAAIFIAYNLFNGFVHPGIDNAAHIGGLVGGFAMGWVLARPVIPEARREPLRQLAIGTLAGAALLLALAWPLFHK
jgi:rhomboid protease GluP